jgi:hypothetical protein
MASEEESLSQEVFVTFDNLSEHRNPSYLVPCVLKAIQMVEILRRTHAGLRVDDLLGMTGYSRSTIYRILRTLTACEYMVRDGRGYYRLNHAIVTVADNNAGMEGMVRPDSGAGLCA